MVGFKSGGVASLKHYILKTIWAIFDKFWWSENSGPIFSEEKWRGGGGVGECSGNVYKKKYGLNFLCHFCMLTL